MSTRDDLVSQDNSPQELLQKQPKPKQYPKLTQYLSRHPKLVDTLKTIIKQRKRDRSYNKFRVFQNIDILEQDRKNRADLMARLRTVTGAIEQDPEMQDFIKSKLTSHSQRFKQHPQSKNYSDKTLDQILTPEEKCIVKILLKGSWSLKHATEHYKSIQESGNMLLSLDERERRGDIPKNGNTPPIDGNTDNVFLTFGPGEMETMHFLEEAQYVFEASYNTLSENNPHSLCGLWNSQHLFAFLAEHTGTQPQSLNIFGVLYTESYQDRSQIKKNNHLLKESPKNPQQDDTNDRKTQFETKVNLDTGDIVKSCRFERPDGSVIIQNIERSDEIFIHPRIDLGLCLKTIEKIRLLGKPAWEKLMSMQKDFSPTPKNSGEELAYNKYLSLLQKLVQSFFHPGTSEAHQPAEFDVNQPGIKTIVRPSKSQVTSANSIETEILKPLILAALQGKEEFVISKLTSHIPLNKTITINYHDINLLGAAILGRSFKLVETLLQKGVDLNTSQLLRFKGISFAFRSILLPFMLATEKCYHSIMKQLLENFSITEQKNLAEASVRILTLLLRQGSAYRSNPFIARADHIDEDEFALILRMQTDPKVILAALALTHFRSHRLGLPFAIALNSRELIHALVERGADINERIGTDMHAESPDFQELPIGCTALIAVVKQGSILMVEVLLQLQANVNLPLIMMENVSQPDALLVQQEEGFTPLMFAVQAGNQEMVKMLLAAGARVTLCSAKGHTAKSLATASKNAKDILPLLAKYETRNDSQIPKNAEEILQQQVNLEAQGIAVQKNNMAIVLIGRNQQDEPFVLLQYNSDQLTKDVKPLAAIHSDSLPHFSQTKWLEAFSVLWTGRKIKSAITWHTLGLCSYLSNQDSIQYATGYMLAVCNQQLSQEILKRTKRGFEGHQIVTASQLKEASKQFHESDQMVDLPSCILTHFDFRLLHLLMNDSKILELPKLDWTVLQNRWQQVYKSRHEVMSAIRRGNRDHVREIAKTVTNLNFEIECLPRPNTQQPHLGGIDQTKLESLTPLQCALENEQYEIADDLITLGAKISKLRNLNDYLKSAFINYKIKFIELIVKYLPTTLSQDDLLKAACYTLSLKGIMHHFPKASPQYAQREAFNHILRAYIGYYSKIKNDKENSENIKIIVQVLDFLQSQTWCKIDDFYAAELEGGLRTAIANHHLPIIQALLPFLKKISWNVYNFPEYLDFFNHHPKIAIDLLGELINPTGYYNTFMNIIENIFAKSEKWIPSFIENIQSIYKEKAPKMITLIEIIRTGQSKRIAEFLKTEGIDPNTFVFMPHVNNNTHSLNVFAQFRTLFKFALDCKQYDCAVQLLHTGARFHNSSWPDSELSPAEIVVLIDEGQIELIELLPKAHYWLFEMNPAAFINGLQKLTEKCTVNHLKTFLYVFNLCNKHNCYGLDQILSSIIEKGNITLLCFLMKAGVKFPNNIDFLVLLPALIKFSKQASPLDQSQVNDLIFICKSILASQNPYGRDQSKLLEINNALLALCKRHALLAKEISEKLVLPKDESKAKAEVLVQTAKPVVQAAKLADVPQNGLPASMPATVSQNSMSPSMPAMLPNPAPAEMPKASASPAKKSLVDRTPAKKPIVARPPAKRPITRTPRSTVAAGSTARPISARIRRTLPAANGAQPSSARTHRRTVTSSGLQQPAMIFSTKPVGASPRPLSASPAKKTTSEKPENAVKPKPEKKEAKKDKP